MTAPNTNGNAPAFTVALPDDLIEQVAQRAADILADRQPAAPEPWLTVEEAAAHLAISTSQVYTLISQRRTNGLPVTADGSRRYFKASALDAWREHRARRPVDATGRIARL